MNDPERGVLLIAREKIPYTIRRSARRKRSIGLTIDFEGGVCVHAPLRAGLAAIERLLGRQQNWINRRRAQLINQESHPRDDDDSVIHLGARYALRIADNRDKPQGCEIGGTFLDVNLDGAPIETAARREEVRLEIMLWRKKEARRIFRERADFWAHQLGVKFRRLTASNPRRQWGSCSGYNDIRINWRLIMAPPELLDYVIVHELCHVAHKNHSVRFWRMVGAALPDWKARRKQLRALDPGIDL